MTHTPPSRSERCARCGHWEDEHRGPGNDMTTGIRFTDGYCIACPIVKGDSSWEHAFVPPAEEERR